VNVLEVSGLSVGYGPQPVVHELDLHVGRGEVVALLGANGAGKTTTLMAVSGAIPSLSGAVQIDGEPATRPLHQRARRGLAYVTEERSVFKGLSVRDNLRVGDVEVEAVLQLFPELEKRMDVRAGLISGGEQQMLSVARALARHPKVLLADELSLGLAPLVVTRLFLALREAARERSTGVLLVEQHVRKALRYVDRVYVMRRGRVVLDLTAAEARLRVADIEHAYLSTSGTESVA
jgi:branched-chain amino acid transport system ATP-binding protein